MGPRLVFSAGEVPEIPASRLSSIANAREPLLFWVHTGHAELQIGDRTRSVTAGAATWVPAGIAYSIRVDPGAVAFPIPMPAADLPPTLNRIIDFEIPAAWQDWLVHQFAHNLGFLRGGATVGAGLLELVAGAHSNDADASVSYAPPNLPRSAETLEIARTLLRTPADDTELSQFARQLKIGVRTLQRRFTEETGLPFARWRTSARIAAAIAYLNSGREIGWTGGQVGFATPAGFTRAFREHTGVTPSDYTRANQAQRRSMRTRPWHRASHSCPRKAPTQARRRYRRRFPQAERGPGSTTFTSSSGSTEAPPGSLSATEPGI